MKIAITTSSFAKFDIKPLEVLKEKGWEITLNPFKRTLNEDEAISLLEDVDGVIAGVEPLNEAVLSKLTKLKVISRLGVGLDNVDLKFSSQNNISVLKTQTTPALAVAELAAGLFIDLFRKISLSNDSLKSGIWEKNMGNLIHGKTLGVIGLGTIGKTLVEILKGFNLNILAFDNNKDLGFSKNHNVQYVSLQDLMTKSDLISIHLNLSPKTKSLINEEMLSLMKKDAIIVNTSRGGIIDESYLNYALENRLIAGAGLDVFSQEPYNGSLTKYDNVVLTPHIGAYAKEIRIEMEKESVQNLINELKRK
jgi:D-3-phosphoglycerate dehydrogenase / 2-oxoglutarate reductase